MSCITDLFGDNAILDVRSGGRSLLHSIGNQVFEILRTHFQDHGYWTLFFALLLENAGVPVPGETVLLFASFLAFSREGLHLPIVILTGVVAATIGDNLGYAIGRGGGRPLLDRYRHLFHISPDTLAAGERLFHRYGSGTVFFARFVFGMRVIAGPLAGVLKMPWGRFVLFNFLGAATWVTVIAGIGFKFGQHWDVLVQTMGRFNLVAGIVAVYVIGFMLWRRLRASRKQATAGLRGKTGKITQVR